MNFDLFVKILDKLQVMGISRVELYNFTEPFLHPNIYEFIAEVKRRGLAIGISSNLSLHKIPRLKECVDLLCDGDLFVITISGMRQEIYQINHRRGKIENVLENIKEIAKSDPSHKRNVRLRLLGFDYNKSEYIDAKACAEKYGMDFECLFATGAPLDPSQPPEYAASVRDQKLNAQDYSDSFSSERIYCPLIHSRSIAMNCRGNVELCCHRVQRPLDLGSFLDQDISVIQLKRDLHPLCRSCNLTDDPWGKALIQTDAVYPQKIDNVLEHAMRTMSLLHQFSQEANFSIDPTIGTSRKFLNNSVNYFMGIV